MGIELVLHLVDRAAWRGLAHRSAAELAAGFEARDLRTLRPSPDTVLARPFDIDLEATWLDWLDAQPPTLDRDEPLATALAAAVDAGQLGLEAAAEGLLGLAEWASAGTWEAWEGRARLYVEAGLGHEVPHIDDLYEGRTWVDLAERLEGQAASAYADAVVMDWMKRRDALGETLDEHLDPHIMPTMVRHRDLAMTLKHALERLAAEPAITAVLGREHLGAQQWGWHGWRLGELVQDPGVWERIVAAEVVLG